MKIANPGSDKWRARRNAAVSIIPLAALLLGIVLSLAGFRLIDRIIRHEEMSTFKLLAERQVLALQHNIERNIETVHALGGLFDASETVSRTEFARFSTQILSRTAGVRALSWNPLVSPGQLADIKRLAQQDGIGRFEFFQKDLQGKPESLTARDDYVPVLYIEPYEINRNALGYDVGSDPVRRAALNLARDNGNAVSSGAVKLVQDGTDEHGFLVFRPVYESRLIPETLQGRRSLIRGYAVGVYRVRDVLKSAPGELAPAQPHITVYDGVGLSRSAKPIYDSGGATERGGPIAADMTGRVLAHTAKLVLPIRTWTVVIRPAQESLSPIQRGTAWTFLAAGVLVSLFVYWLLVSSRMQSQVIEKEVESRTRELETEIVERKSIEAALQRSERTYAKLAEMAPVGILIFKDRKVDQANLAAADLLGAATPTGLIGRRRAEFLKPEDRDEADRRWNVVKEGRAVRIWEVETVRLDGVSFPSVVRMEHVDIDGHNYTIVVVQDVSVARQTEQAIRESEEKYRSLIEFFPQGVLLTDQGKITQINPAGLELCGARNEDEILGRDWMSLVEISHREIMLGRRRTMAEGESVEPVELEMLRLDGTSYWARSQAMPIQLSGKTFFMTVFADIAGRKLAEEEIRRANAELVRSNEELAQFASVASHDLKEPLRMVSSYCDLIASRYTDKLDETGKKFIYYATDGAKRMQTLIDDLLLYSRVGRGGEKEEPVDLTHVVADVRELMSEAIRESDAVITVEGLPVVSGFRSELSRLFQNLIGNAIKFRSDDPPRIEIKGLAEDGGVTITVADNGIGIPPEHRGRIFGVFQRLHSRDKYEGTGIGLAICAKVLEQMGGEIRVESAAGGGSIFVLTIPGERLNSA